MRIELRPRLERDASRGDRLDGLTRDHLDGALLQGLLRVGAEVRLEHREELRAGLDEDDAGLLLRHGRVVLGEVSAVELRERAGALDPGRPAADDDDVQRAVVDEAGSLSAASQRPSTCSLSRTASGSVYMGKACSGAPLVPKKLTSAPSPSTR